MRNVTYEEGTLMIALKTRNPKLMHGHLIKGLACTISNYKESEVAEPQLAMLKLLENLLPPDVTLKQIL